MEKASDWVVVDVDPLSSAIPAAAAPAAAMSEPLSSTIIPAPGPEMDAMTSNSCPAIFYSLAANGYPLISSSVEERLVAQERRTLELLVSGLSLTLVDTGTGPSYWLQWLHETHPAATTPELVGRHGAPGPLKAAWLVFESAHPEAAVYCICFHSLSDAEALAELLEVVRPAWSAQMAAAVEDGAKLLQQGVRSAADAMAWGVRWLSDAVVENVEGAGDREAEVDPELARAVRSGRVVAGRVAEVGTSVAAAVSGAAYYAGQGASEMANEMAETAGVPSENPQLRGAREVSKVALGAAYDVVTEMGASMQTVMSEAGAGVKKVVAHTSGDAAAEVADDALGVGASVATTVSACAPVCVLRKAAMASALGAAGVEPEDTSASTLTSRSQSLPGAFAGPSVDDRTPRR